MPVLTIFRRAEPGAKPSSYVTLPFELRKRSRLRTHLDSGEEVALMLERGHILRGGDLLLAEDGQAVEIVAAPETLSVVKSADPWQLARASYHLGNRHVSLQIGPGWLRYQHDHVLDDMVRGLGLEVSVEQVPFEPEAGAYAAAGQGHGGGHGHGHE